jgi:hypothetical protein
MGFGTIFSSKEITRISSCPYDLLVLEGGFTLMIGLNQMLKLLSLLLDWSFYCPIIGFG